MCGRKTSSNITRSSLFCTTGPCFWPDKRSEHSRCCFSAASLGSARRTFDRCADKDKGAVPFGTFRISRFYDDLCNHMRMQTAEIIESSGTSERKRIRVVSVERLRPEYLVLIDHRVRGVVVIDPLD